MTILDNNDPFIFYLDKDYLRVYINPEQYNITGDNYAIITKQGRINWCENILYSDNYENIIQFIENDILQIAIEDYQNYFDTEIIETDSS